MTTYTLDIRCLIDGPDGLHQVNVFCNGRYRYRMPSAQLQTSTKFGEWGYAFIPMGAPVLHEPTRRPDYVHPTSGTAHYDFESHQEALDFLASLYGIGVPEPADAPTNADSPAPAQQPTDSPRSIPAPLARDVAAPSAFPLAGRQIGPLFHLFWGTSNDATPTIRRNTQ